MSKVLILSLMFTASVLSTASLAAGAECNTQGHSFGVDYENNTFLLDGKPFRYVSGSFHYFRTPKVNWRDRLRKMRAAGLNAVSTYVEWSLHQPTVDTWLWTGEADLEGFLKMAQEEDLFVLLRPGPYICAERNLGGLPPWLMTLVPDIKMRTNDPRYMEYVTIYLNETLTRVKPYLRGCGGPVIMVQIENEYGSFHACDVAYRRNLLTIFQSHIQDNALLYTTDGSSVAMLRCGYVPFTYTTIDFGTSANVTKNFEIMRQYQPSGPLVNSEFYPGWLTHWGENLQTVTTAAVTRVLDEMLALGASVNIYMFYGGTNFGFTSGANGPADYLPQITSYDYDAPINESGDLTEKYYAIRDVIKKYLPLPNITIEAVNTSKGNYGPVEMRSVVKLFDEEARRRFGSINATYKIPPTFEELGVPNWLVLYETELLKSNDPSLLYALTHDRALVYVDSRLTAILSRIRKIFTTSIANPYAKRLQLLVENQGHLNFGNLIEDFKGIFNVRLNNQSLSTWNVTAFKMDSVKALDSLNSSDSKPKAGLLEDSPVFLRGKFNVAEVPQDTYLDTSEWGKGVAYVNGHNLGRYWPVVGPQVTLYVPASYLITGENELVILELESIAPDAKMTFKNTPNLG